MKTTIELPDDLVKRIKLRALREGKKLKDAIADLLRKGLKVAPATKGGKHKFRKDPKTGLMVFSDRHSAAAGDELTPERTDEILLAQEVERFNDACR